MMRLPSTPPTRRVGPDALLGPWNARHETDLVSSESAQVGGAAVGVMMPNPDEVVRAAGGDESAPGRHALALGQVRVQRERAHHRGGAIAAAAAAARKVVQLIAEHETLVAPGHHRRHRGRVACKSTVCRPSDDARRAATYRCGAPDSTPTEKISRRCDFSSCRTSTNTTFSRDLPILFPTLELGPESRASLRPGTSTTRSHSSPRQTPGYVSLRLFDAPGPLPHPPAGRLTTPP